MAEHTMIDTDIEHAQHVRRTVIAKLMADGKVPVDNESINVLLSAANDLSKTSLVLKKMSNDDQNAQADRMVHLAAAEVIARGGNGAFVRRSGESPNSEPIPEFDVIEGELTLEHRKTNYKEFMERNDPEYMGLEVAKQSE